MPFSETFLIWILNTFDISSNIVTLCFDYILLLRVVINIFGNLNEGNPKGFTTKNVNYVKELFHVYVLCNVLFKKEHLILFKYVVMMKFSDHFLIILFSSYLTNILNL